jgi:hypothetical protein
MHYTDAYSLLLLCGRLQRLLFRRLAFLLRRLLDE